MNLSRTLRTLFASAALSAAAFIALPAPQAHAAVVVSVAIAPPAIPVYDQPIMPGDGYLWTPGYWAYGPDGYYWVDGAWVEPPYAGALWTPGWWGFYGGAYVWYPGYWGRTVGYYGGINYGFGYFGVGFYGGYWNGGHFFYNRAYAHVPEGFRGGVYSRSYAGFNARPGGAAFNAHPPAQYANAHAFSGANGANFNHQTPNGGRSFAQPQQNFGGNRGSVGNAAPRYSAPANNGSRGGSAPAPAPRSAPSGGGSRSSGGGSSHSGGGGHH